MDPLSIDPHMAELGARLTEMAARNVAATVFTKMRAAKSKKNDAETINELDGIVSELLSDRNDLVQIAQAYEQELVAQRISDKDIKYIIDSVIPVLKNLIDQAAGGAAAEEATKIREAIDALTPLLSVEMLTVLQLVGFNFKRAIGEPLTLLVQKLITSRIPADQATALEISRLNAAFSTELARVAQDEETTARWERLRDFRSAES